MYYFWTDGSSSLKTGMCGWAAICYLDLKAIEEKLGTKESRREIYYGFEEGTNQKAELLAILYALKNTMPGAKVFVKTDSEYAINCITKYRKVWEKDNYTTSSGNEPKNLAILKEIWHLYDAREVTIAHVRGHQGFAGNEAADYVAGLARRMGEGQFDQLCVETLVKEKLTYDRIHFKKPP